MRSSIEGGMLQQPVPVLQRWGGVREPSLEMPVPEKMRPGQRQSAIFWNGVQGRAK